APKTVVATADSACPSSRRSQIASASTTISTTAAKPGPIVKTPRGSAASTIGIRAASGIPTASIGRAPPARAIRNSSHAPTAPVSASSPTSGAPPITMIQMVSGAATTPNAMRWASSGMRLDRDAAETAFPVQEIQDRVVQLAASEIRPQHRRDEQLSVGHLPEQKIGDPLLTRGANQQIGIGTIRRVQSALKIGLGDLLRHEAAVPRVPRQALRRPHQLRAAAGRDEQIEPEPVVVLRL